MAASEVVQNAASGSREFVPVVDAIDPSTAPPVFVRTFPSSDESTLDVSFETSKVNPENVLIPSDIVSAVTEALKPVVSPSHEDEEFQDFLKEMGIDGGQLSNLPLLQVPVSYVVPFLKGEPQKLCMRQSKSGKWYGLAGGKMLSEESPENAALREAEEEMGVTFKSKHVTFLAETHLAGFSSMWPEARVADHGYTAPKGVLKHDGRVATIHPTQYFYSVPISDKAVPNKFDGREYKIIDITDEEQRALIHPRMLPIVQLWADVVFAARHQEASIAGLTFKELEPEPAKKKKESSEEHTGDSKAKKKSAKSEVAKKSKRGKK